MKALTENTRAEMRATEYGGAEITVKIYGLLIDYLLQQTSAERIAEMLWSDDGVRCRLIALMASDPGSWIMYSTGDKPDEEEKSRLEFLEKVGRAAIGRTVRRVSDAIARIEVYERQFWNWYHERRFDEDPRVRLEVPNWIKHWNQTELTEEMRYFDNAKEFWREYVGRILQGEDLETP